MSSAWTVRGKYYLWPMKSLPYHYLMWARQNITHMSAGCERRLEQEISRRFEQKKYRVPRYVYHMMPKKWWRTQVKKDHFVPRLGYLWCAGDTNTPHTVNQHKSEHKIMLRIDTTGLKCRRVYNNWSQKHCAEYYVITGAIPLPQIHRYRKEYNRLKYRNHNMLA